jgi:hypothetical protein
MAAASIHPANSGALRSLENGSRSAVERAVVLIVSVELIEELLGVMDAEGVVQLVPDGSPALQDSVTVPLKLFFPVTTIWKMAAFPAVTVTLAGLPAIVKLGATTTWLKTVEVLAANMESPPYAAVIE